LTRRWLKDALGYNKVLCEEVDIIKGYLGKLSAANYYVDIGASNGISASNTRPLEKQKWSGIAIESDAKQFAILSNFSLNKDIKKIHLKVTSRNILEILDACDCPKDFGFLNLDIDSFDFYVLKSILSSYRPLLICAEINERIPPPIKFAVKEGIDPSLLGGAFYGMSIEKCAELCEQYKYDIAFLHYNNIFLIPSEHNKWGALTTRDAYARGYVKKEDRKKIFYWNRPYDYLIDLEINDLRGELARLFADRNDKYDLS
jgi:hypothetical protein